MVRTTNRVAKANAILAAVTVCGGISLLWTSVANGLPLVSLTFVLGVAMVVVSELYPLAMPQGSINLASAGFFSILLVYGINPALWVLTIGGALAFVRAPFRGLRSVSSLGNYVLSLTLAVAFLHWVHVRRNDLLLYIPIAVVVFTVVNHTLVNVYYYVLQGAETIHGIALSLTWDMVGWVITLPLALTFLYLHQTLAGWGSALAAIPFAALAVSIGLWQQVRQHNDRMETAARGSARIAQATTSQELFQVVSEALAETIGYSTLSIHVWDTAHQQLDAAYLVHPHQAQLPAEALIVRPGLGIAGAVLASGDAELIVDLDKDPRFHRNPVDPLHSRSALVVPLKTDSDVLGLVVATHEDLQHYSQEHLQLARILAAQAAVALERNELYRQKEHLSLTDPMIPELYNYRWFKQVLSKAVAEGSRDQPVSLAFLDLDHFKGVNDSFGHPTGDSVLREVVRLARHAVRQQDVLARYAGDEFVLLLTHTSEAEAIEVVERVALAVESHRFAEIGSSLTISCGVASFPGDAESEEQLLALADARMYLQKSARRQRVRHPETSEIS